MSSSGQPPQRVAFPADADAIQPLMRASIRELFPRFYEAAYTESAVRYIGELDMALVVVRLPDGTELAGVAMERPCAPS